MFVIPLFRMDQVSQDKNEWVNIDDLVACAKIYAWTLYKLSTEEIPENPLEEEKL